MRTLRLLAVLLLPFLSGCLEMEQTIAITADGSGTHQVRMTIRETTLAEVERVGAAAGAMSEAARALFDKELVRRDLEAVGLTLAAHATEAKGRKRHVEVTAAFPTFAALQQSPLAGSRAEWTLAAGPKPGTVKLTLYPQGKAAWTEARAKADSMQTEGDPIAEAFFRKKQAELTGLDLVVRFQVPGDVLVYTANMEKTGDREVTARIAADQIKTPQDLVRRLAPRFEVIFDGKDCKLPLQ
jgi:hypothetical protein